MKRQHHVMMSFIDWIRFLTQGTRKSSNKRSLMKNKTELYVCCPGKPSGL